MSDHHLGPATEPAVAPAAEESAGEVPATPSSEEPLAHIPEEESQRRPAPDWWEDA